MNTAAKWSIIIGVGILGVLILIGLIGLLIRFFMKRCRRKAWIDISSLPKQLDSLNNTTGRKPQKPLSAEQEPLCPPTPNVASVSDGHITIPVSDGDFLPGSHQQDNTAQHESTIVQSQRDYLARLKEENRSRPMLHLSTEELDIKRAITQAQKEFEESV